MYQIGITSHRPTSRIADALSGLREWQALLSERQIDAQVTLGQGAWQGGREPSFVTRISRDAQLREVIQVTCQFALTHDQDAAIVIDREGHDHLIAEFRFSDLTQQHTREIEATLIDAGIGGWTWVTEGIERVLQIAHIPQWDGLSGSEFRSVIESVSEAVQVSADIAEATVLTFSGDSLIEHS